MNGAVGAFPEFQYFGVNFVIQIKSGVMAIFDQYFRGCDIDVIFASNV